LKQTSLEAMSQFNQQVDFGKTADDYAQFRAGFPDVLFERLAMHGIGLPGQRMLDLGTGTGSLARGFARRGARVAALDPARSLLRQAQRLDQQAQVTVGYITARAERLPWRSACFDVITAGQCWHWFDRPAVLAQLSGILKPGGRLVIAHFDWIPLPGNVAQQTESLIERYNPAWHFGGGTGLYPHWLPELGIARFTQVETFSLDVEVPYTHAAWRGRIRASAGVAATLTSAEVANFDHDLANLLAAKFPDPLLVPHRVFAILSTPPRVHADTTTNQPAG
jgi:2-polyprenyl-3-methyl-5-hydroxy-6-metoxy-1,4-benzoquinol methylase